MSLNRSVMSWQNIADNWRAFRGSLRERWGRLSELDLDQVDGRRQRLLGVLQARYGVDAEHADALLLEWQKDVVENGPTLVLWPPHGRLAGQRH